MFENAECMLLAECSTQGLLKYLYLHRADILFNPFIKYRRKKFTEICRPDTCGVALPEPVPASFNQWQKRNI